MGRALWPSPHSASCSVWGPGAGPGCALFPGRMAHLFQAGAPEVRDVPARNVFPGLTAALQTPTGELTLVLAPAPVGILGVSSLVPLNRLG